MKISSVSKKYINDCSNNVLEMDSVLFTKDIMRVKELIQSNQDIKIVATIICMDVCVYMPAVALLSGVEMICINSCTSCL